MRASSLALCATLPLSTRPQEWTGPRPELDELFKDPLEFKDGQITLRDRPGLGLEIDENALAKAVIS
jgi:L-alanine-DL-glutamate epimerase-like enolase superfamily enzyme